MRIGDIYRDRSKSSIYMRTFVIINLSGPYAYAKYLDHGKLRSAEYPRREITENPTQYKKIGYINLEKIITDKLSRLREVKYDRM